MNRRSPTSESDGTLIRAVLDGDTERFGALVGRHDSLVRRTVGRTVADPLAREDAVQETWFLAYRRLGDLVQPRKIRSWLTTIARNCALDQRRARDASPTQPLRVELSATGSPDADDWLWRLVERMPDELADALTRHYRDGQSYEEIAAVLGLAPSTVRGRIYTARQELRRRLAARPEGER